MTCRHIRLQRRWSAGSDCLSPSPLWTFMTVTVTVTVIVIVAVTQHPSRCLCSNFSLYHAFARHFTGCNLSPSPEHPLRTSMGLLSSTRPVAQNGKSVGQRIPFAMYVLQCSAWACSFRKNHRQEMSI